MKNLKTLSIIAIVLVELFATSCTPDNLDNDQTEQQILLNICPSKSSDY